MEVHRAFPNSRESPREARMWASECCRQWGRHDAVDAISLVIDELVMNAMTHAGSGAEITLRCDTGAIHGAVRDHGPGHVSMLDASSTRIGGWGMTIVASLTRAWHVDYAADGKTVNFEIASDGPAGGPSGG